MKPYGTHIIKVTIPGMSAPLGDHILCNSNLDASFVTTPDMNPIGVILTLCINKPYPIIRLSLSSLHDCLTKQCNNHNDTGSKTELVMCQLLPRNKWSSQLNHKGTTTRMFGRGAPHKRPPQSSPTAVFIMAGPPF